MGGMGLRSRLPLPFQHRSYALYWLAVVATWLGRQMVVVAVGWQVYAIHESPLDLGLIGLAEFVPMLLLALPAGHIGDRFPRRLVLAASLALELVVLVLFVAVTLTDAQRLWPFIALAAGAGATSALGMPSGRALPAMVVPRDVVPAAMTFHSIGFQGSIVAGPAIGGLLFTVDPVVVYATAAALAAVGIAGVLAIRVEEVGRAQDQIDMSTVFAGIRFIRNTPVLLGAISLDLFAVLFGGMVALLPLFARSILHVGPIGLGIMRSAPAVGALAAGIVLARRPLRRNVGRTLLVAVALFGAQGVVFGLSRSLALSCVALAFGGFVDMISMNIRATTVALATPNELRGRVLAVEMVFISASNELGAFESGLAAALLGAVTSVVAGGAITLGLAGVWGVLFPALAGIDRYEDIHAGSLETDGDRSHPPDPPA
jgi:MFS family permease